MQKRILLAEDEPNIVESIRFVLTRAGYDVSVCNTGRKALHETLETTPDVVVLDVMLPEMDGFEVLRNLRADARGRLVPVLILTAKGQREDRDRALETGANMFISKPFANSELVDAVGQLAGSEAKAH